MVFGCFISVLRCFVSVFFDVSLFHCLAVSVLRCFSVLMFPLVLSQTAFNHVLFWCLFSKIANLAYCSHEY